MSQLGILILALALQVHANPNPSTLSCAWFNKVSTAVQGFQDQSWLWGWAWGPDSTVSIVDRSPPVTFPSRPAGFGAELSDSLLGYVIPLNSFTVSCSNTTATSLIDSPNLGCPHLCSIDPDIPQRLEPWIALVQRGACQFVSKAREAQRLGAKAIVVGGEDPDISGKPDTLVNMFSPGSSGRFLYAFGLSHVQQRGCLGRDHRSDVHQVFQLCRALFSHRHVKYLSGWAQDCFPDHPL